jgi:hypothetical protein
LSWNILKINNKQWEIINNNQWEIRDFVLDYIIFSLWDAIVVSVTPQFFNYIYLLKLCSFLIYLVNIYLESNCFDVWALNREIYIIYIY